MMKTKLSIFLVSLCLSTLRHSQEETQHRSGEEAWITEWWSLGFGREKERGSWSDVIEILNRNSGGFNSKCLQKLKQRLRLPGRH